MADILRVTSPVINKNIIQPDKALKDPSVPFDMQEIRHITKNPSGSGLLGHHNVLEGEAGAATLMNLLKDPAVTVNYLKNIYMLEEIINLLPVNNNTVTQEIRQLADSVRGLEIEVEVQGEDGEAYMALSPIVYSCFREAITNCLKYAQASHMDVIVKLEEERLCLYIFDDGQGCAEVQENNGIRGIRERVRLAGGTVRIMTAEGEGFQIYLELPVKREQNNHVEVTGDDKGNHSG